MLFEAYKDEQETRLWQQYLTTLPNMDENHFTSYEDYKEEAFREVKNESIETILQRAEKIKNADKLRKEGKK